MVCLCSKTYCIKKFGDENNAPVTKMATKGMQKRVLENDTEEEPLAKMQRVLDTKENLESNNRGFRVRDNAIHTYTQRKKGLAYFYCKRKVLDDGIHTEPLDL